MPEGIHWKNEVPNREGNEVDQHPEDVDHLARRDENEDRGEADDCDEEHERDGFFEGVWRVERHVDNESVG